VIGEDARFFEENPERIDYVRERAPGEFGTRPVPLDAKIHVIRVHGSGVMIRLPVPDKDWLGECAHRAGMGLVEYAVELMKANERVGAKE